jgi:hypothetical protein
VVWEPAGPNCRIRLDGGVEKQVDGMGSADGNFFGVHDAPSTLSVSLGAANAAGDGAASMFQVRTTAASPQLFTVWAAVRWVGDDCVANAQVLGG